MAERIRPRDVANMTSLSIRKVQELAERGEIPSAAKQDDEWTFVEAEVRAWIKSQETPRLSPVDRERERRAKKAAAAMRAAKNTVSADYISANAMQWPASGCGIYFLIADGKIMYVGRAVCVVTRLAQHTLTKRFDSWFWVPCSSKRLEMVERAYIDAFDPPWNLDPVTVKRRRAARG